MTTPAPGWYDDPATPENNLRYWDGQSWTDQTAPRPQGNPAQAAYNQGAYNQGGPVPQGYAPGVPSTADGVPLADYGSRVGAYLLDGLILALINLIPGIPMAVPAFSKFMEGMQAAGSDPAALQGLQAELQSQLLPFSLVALVIVLAYHLFFLTRSGQTPGKKMLGIAVRRADRPGPLSLVDAAKRMALYVGLQLIGLVGALSTIASLVGLVDLLWPLWDSKRQALHDKIGQTQVVRVR